MLLYVAMCKMLRIKFCHVLVDFVILSGVQIIARLELTSRINWNYGGSFGRSVDVRQGRLVVGVR